MSMNDPVADMLTRIRNAITANKVSVSMPSSKAKVAIAQVLKDEGFINEFTISDDPGKPTLDIVIKYYMGKPVIEMIKRISSPGLRVYKRKDELPVVKGGLGIAIVSTSSGLMTERKARKEGYGGEVICYVA